MALKSTIYKASLQIADMDRQLYADHALTLALHPSETEERLMMRVLAFSLHVPKDDTHGALVSARGLSDADEPDLWQRDLTGQLVQWIEVGQPDDRRLAKACARAQSVALYAYSSAAPIWWSGIESKLGRLNNLDVWAVEPQQSQSLAALCERAMVLQFTIQDGHVWVHGARDAAQLAPRALRRAAPAR
jgi:uncharacterized protein YaeQ